MQHASHANPPLVQMFDPHDSGMVAVDQLRHALSHLAQMADSQIDELIAEATAGTEDKDHISIDACVEHIFSF